jgi:hypothetical protein
MWGEKFGCCRGPQGATGGMATGGEIGLGLVAGVVGGKTVKFVYRGATG